MPSASKIAAATLAVGGAAFVLFGAQRPARATPRPLPVTYNYETLGKGEAEVEQYADLTPILGSVPNAPGLRKMYLGTQFQTEYEYGITDRLELGLYVTLAPFNGFADSNSPMLEGTGVKQRLRYRFADEGVLPVDTAVYGEVTENENYVEIEAKLILQKRFGSLRAVVNLVGEHEFYYDGANDWEINPSAGLTYQITPMFQPGLEYWVNAEWPDPGVSPRPRVLGPNHYVGPVMLLELGRLWWSTGAYLRVNDLGAPVEIADGFGSVYFRTVIGFGL